MTPHPFIVPIDFSPTRTFVGRVVLGFLFSTSLLFAACGSETVEDAGIDNSIADVTATVPATVPVTVPVNVIEEAASDTSSEDVAADVGDDESHGSYLGDYTLDDAEFGTQVSVSVDGTTRTIIANALPDHETGEFPTEGNPNTISAQDVTYSYPTEPVFEGDATAARTPGVAVNGVKFEPETAETVDCESGETYRVEALQDLYNLGLDFNNAHVQPTGEYHYHGVSELLAEAHATDEDLVLVGFAADGYLIYYSKSGAYSSGFELSTTIRTGTDCIGSGALRNASVEIDATTPDGAYVSDWVHNAEAGELDRCNGIEIDGSYSYLITDEYPFVSRCLNGAFTESRRGRGPG